jgi:NAD(P)H-dependent nitrite reductase small subunit
LALKEFRKVASTDQIPHDEGLVVIVEDREIAIFQCNGKYFAIENSCPHRGGPIADGELEGEIISCPWHAWPFDLATGKCTINNSAQLETYKLKIEEGEILIELNVEADSFG